MKQYHHSLVRRGRGFITSFSRDERGSLLPMVAGSMLMLTGAAGVAIDGARMFYVKDVLQKSLDSAGLAAGHAMSVNDMESDAREFFNANVGSMAGVVSSSNMVVDISDDNELITLTASASVDATFMRLFGYEAITVSASTEVSRETRGMELVLVMDNTGSMAWDDKIGTMKTAATNLVNIVFGDDETNTNLWAGVVPYITHVNVGNGNYNWLSESGKDKVDNEYYSTEWKGCLEARADGEDETDTPPTEIPFEPFYWNDTDPYWQYHKKKGWYQVDEDNNWIDDDSGDVTINEVNNRSSARGPNRGCASEITPLVAEKSKLIAAIDVMEPWSFGGTAANYGLVWGWRVISPRWRGLWSGSPANLPLDHDTPYMDKVIVMLTDGVNELISADSELGGSDYTAFGRLDEFGYANIYDARDEFDDRFDRICQNIKNDDVLIYTITFGSTPDEDTQSAYAACASNPAFYFHAPTASSLTDAFEEIGRQLSNLRLSK
ncbi:TadE/TadG family type IV pilus assembly protein [Kordiimonas aestuarii]|uniref:TadE/TadG family type IV pilus assembly protein n=1 Tax=Kordiimonas aestuarii TaxID=1005925 RepID=UPI0021D3180F|nr:TadE/TadG family type IV pilus assembly protein [Kordiimonas aestuarii]